MKKLIMLMGKTSSGKSTLEQNLVKYYPNKYKQIISHTTRAMRANEIDGETYHYIKNDENGKTAKEKFKEMELNGEFLQVTHYDTEYYASAKSEYFSEKENTLLVVTPAQAYKLKEKFRTEYPDIEVIIVYFDISDELIKSNMIKRGDSPDRIKKRLKNDRLREEFQETGMKADFLVDDKLLDDQLVHKFHKWNTKK